MKKSILYMLLIGLTVLHAQPSMDENHSAVSGEMFVHPFLVHMGLPDQPGEVSLRTHLMQTNFEGNLTTDLGLHIEAGLIKRLGLHIRNDAFHEEEYSEIMLQFAPLINRADQNGFAVFGQLDFPTGAPKSTHYKVLVGVSGELTLPTFTYFNGAIHYDFEETMVEYEGSFVFRASKILYPIIESNGMFSKDMKISYVLPAVKFRINPVSAFGVGVQLPVSSDREFDIRALATYEFVLGM